MNPDNKDSIRLNKHLALQLGLSRREADDYIAQKRVSVNGKLAELGSRIAEGDSVTVDDTPVKDNTAFVYLALNKPIGYDYLQSTPRGVSDTQAGWPTR